MSMAQTSLEHACESHPPTDVDMCGKTTRTDFDHCDDATRTISSAATNLKKRRIIVRAIANAITTVDDDGARMWSASFNRTIVPSVCEALNDIFGPQERIQVSDCTSHAGFVFERSPMASLTEFVDAITSGKPISTGYVCVSATVIAHQPK